MTINKKTKKIQKNKLQKNQKISKKQIKTKRNKKNKLNKTKISKNNKTQLRTKKNKKHKKNNKLNKTKLTKKKKQYGGTYTIIKNFEKTDFNNGDSIGYFKIKDTGSFIKFGYIYYSHNKPLDIRISSIVKNTFHKSIENLFIKNLPILTINKNGNISITKGNNNWVKPDGNTSVNNLTYSDMEDLNNNKSLYIEVLKKIVSNENIDETLKSHCQTLLTKLDNKEMSAPTAAPPAPTPAAPPSAAPSAQEKIELEKLILSFIIDSILNFINKMILYEKIESIIKLINKNENKKNTLKKILKPKLDCIDNIKKFFSQTEIIQENYGINKTNLNIFNSEQGKRIETKIEEMYNYENTYLTEFIKNQYILNSMIQIKEFLLPIDNETSIIAYYLKKYELANLIKNTIFILHNFKSINIDTQNVNINNYLDPLIEHINILLDANSNELKKKKNNINFLKIAIQCCLLNHSDKKSMFDIVKKLEFDNNGDFNNKLSEFTNYFNEYEDLKDSIEYAVLQKKKKKNNDNPNYQLTCIIDQYEEKEKKKEINDIGLLICKFSFTENDEKKTKKEFYIILKYKLYLKSDSGYQFDDVANDFHITILDVDITIDKTHFFNKENVDIDKYIKEQFCSDDGYLGIIKKNYKNLKKYIDLSNCEYDLKDIFKSEEFLEIDSKGSTPNSFLSTGNFKKKLYNKLIQDDTEHKVLNTENLATLNSIDALENITFKSDFDVYKGITPNFFPFIYNSWVYSYCLKVLN